MSCHGGGGPPREKVHDCAGEELADELGLGRLRASPMNHRDHSEAEANEQSSGETVVCTGCVAINPARADYCSKCGAPLNSLLAFSPFEQTLIEGFAYRRAVEGPASRMVLVGMWVLFGPAFVIVPFLIMPDLRRIAGPSDIPVFLFAHAESGVWVLLSALVLYRATANYFSKRKSPPAAEV
jgi:ribosomal protein L40E